MGIFRSVMRYLTTLGGLLSSRVDQEADALTTTPQGVKAAFRGARETWKKQYQDVRDAVSQLMMVMETKRDEIKKLEKEQDELETKKRGAVEKFKQTRDEKFQTLFGDLHSRHTEVGARLETLNQEVVDLRGQVDRFKLKLGEMQAQIQNLDRQEAEAIADIVTSKQIVQLNDRMAQLGTSLQDENLQAIERTRQLLKAKAKLSDELAGTDRAQIEKEVLEAGLSGDAMDEFSQMLAESELKSKEKGESPAKEADRTM